MMNLKTTTAAWLRRGGAAVAGMAMLASGAAYAEGIDTFYSFVGGIDGAFPYGTPVAGTDGFLYGSTYFGSETSTDPYTGYGTVYKIKPDGSKRSTLHVFSGSGDDGGIPIAPLLLGADGKYYGSTEGSSDFATAPYGTIFKVKTNGTFTTLHTFAGSDGRFITGKLVQDAGGMLYGVTQAGGTYDFGVIFKMKTDGSKFTVLHEFTGADGYSPVQGLTLAADGKLYGTASYGGVSGMGTIFSIKTNGKNFVALYHFSGPGDGGNPYSQLVQGSDGYLYGSTNVGGGSCGCGTVFKVDTAGTLTTLHTFSGGTDGSAPREGMVVDANGAIYGTTYNGGSVGAGAAYKIGTDGSLLGLISFENLNGLPTGFTAGADGTLYSTSIFGGANNVGALFSVDPASSFVLPAVPVTTLTSDKTSVSGKETATLTWSSTDADSCEASGDWSGTAPTSGSKKVVPAGRGTHAYTMTCSGAGGSASATVTIVKTK
jgi:uncharacterized repeat protein (TIGR03803 family)